MVKKESAAKKSYGKKKSSAEKKSVAEIVVDRLIQKIQEEQKLPWQKPFQASCMNWFSKREYMGINKILLDGGEYMTVNQLKQYNEKNKVNFWFEAGTPWDIVVFYNKHDKIISDELARAIINDPKRNSSSIFPTDKGWAMRTWFLKYFRVYNIKYIKDKEGNTLTPHIGNGVVEDHTPADEIVAKYVNASGVEIKTGMGAGAYYTEHGDYVNMPQKTNFLNTEAYYRVLFHELVHSTGVASRLNRPSLANYHEGRKERSKEELIAEVGGLLLASEAGFREDTELAENSDSYIVGWCSWMKNNQNEVLNGMLAAEKAKSYILSGGVKASGSSERSIDNPDAPQDEDAVDAIADEAGKPPVSEEPTTSNSPEPTKESEKVDIKSLKSKKAVTEYYHSHLSPYFAGEVTEAEQKVILDGIKAIELKYLYFVLTKEKLPASRKKVEVMSLIRQVIENGKKVG